MSALGYIQVHAFAGNSQIPLKDVAVTITDAEGNALAMRLTNRSGLLDNFIEISVPELSAGQSPGIGITPYSTINLQARLEDFEEISINNIQVFPQTITLQNLEMIPLAEFPAKWNKAQEFDTPSQNL